MGNGERGNGQEKEEHVVGDRSDKESGKYCALKLAHQILGLMAPRFIIG